MMDNGMPAPDDALLQRFMLGQVADAEAELLERHVVECGRCSRRIDDPRVEDDLVAAMRERSAVLAGLEPDISRRLIERVRMLHAERDEPATGFQLSSAGVDSVLDGGGDTLVSTPSYDFLDPPSGPEEIGRIAHYRVRGVLGSGGMGIVFRADDLRLKRTVALKVLLDARYAEPRYVARFRGEAEALARLHHPSIVQVFETG